MKKIINRRIANQTVKNQTIAISFSQSKNSGICKIGNKSATLQKDPLSQSHSSATPSTNNKLKAILSLKAKEKTEIISPNHQNSSKLFSLIQRGQRTGNIQQRSLRDNILKIQAKDQHSKKSQVQQKKSKFITSVSPEEERKQSQQKKLQKRVNVQQKGNLKNKLNGIDPVISELQKTLLSQLSDGACAKEFNKNYFMEQVNSELIGQLQELELAFSNFFQQRKTMENDLKECVMYFEDFLRMLEALCQKSTKLQAVLIKIKEVFEAIFMDIIEEIYKRQNQIISNYQNNEDMAQVSQANKYMEDQIKYFTQKNAKLTSQYKKVVQRIERNMDEEDGDDMNQDKQAEQLVEENNNFKEILKAQKLLINQSRAKEAKLMKLIYIIRQREVDVEELYKQEQSELSISQGQFNNLASELINGEQNSKSSIMNDSDLHFFNNKKKLLEQFQQDSQLIQQKLNKSSKSPYKKLLNTTDEENLNSSSYLEQKHLHQNKKKKINPHFKLNLDKVYQKQMEEQAFENDESEDNFDKTHIAYST